MMHRLFAGAVLGIALAAATVPGVAYAQTGPTPAEQSSPGDKPPDARIDGSTVQEASKALTEAGYKDLKMLQKGFDSVWHFTATRDGKAVFVSWSRSGGAHLEEQ